MTFVDTIVAAAGCAALFVLMALARPSSECAGGDCRSCGSTACHARPGDGGGTSS